MSGEVLATGPRDDENPYVLHYDPADRAADNRWLRVYAYIGHDGVPVVQIDTTEALGQLRININDDPVWDADPETGQPLPRTAA